MQIDDKMMTELQGIQQSVNPSDTLLVVDAMTGQEAAGLVKAFNDAAPLTGLCLLGEESGCGGRKILVPLLCLHPIRLLVHI